MKEPQVKVENKVENTTSNVIVPPQPSERKKKVIPVASIALTPSVITFSHKEKYPQKREITVLGIRGGIYSNVLLTNNCAYDVSGSSNITVDNVMNPDGTAYCAVIIKDGVIGQKATITARYLDPTMGVLHDTINVIVSAK